MRLKSMAAALVGALVVMSFALTASPQPTNPQPPPGTQFAGQMTEAHVWVDNRGAEQAIPVDLRALNTDRALRVQIVNNDPQYGQTGPVPVRTARVAWEYRTMTLGPGDDLAARLNTLGADGWEAAGIVSLTTETTTVMFKRPRASP
jgi:opacity protein-like surface antigen